MNWLIDVIYFFSLWYVWIPVAALLLYLTYRNYSREEDQKNIEGELLMLEIPRTNDKSELAAEQMFASLHGILRTKDELSFNNNTQEHLSFEIASVNGQIRFYVWVPKNLRSFVESQIYAQYPSVQIRLADEDYVAHERQHSVIHTAEITLIDKEFLPIKTFSNFEVDPLAGITGTLAKLESTGEEVWIQILVRPIADKWHKNSEHWISSVRRGSLKGDSFISQFVKALWTPPSYGKTTSDVSDRDKTRISEAEKKSSKLGYEVKIRLAYLGESGESARQRMQAIVGTFKQYNSTNLNGFTMTSNSFKKEDLDTYRSRYFKQSTGYILNIEELASVFHLPHTNVETPNIVWASSKTAEPPSTLPVITGEPVHDENVSAFGLTNFRGINHQFGLLRSDRARHVYIIGQTGTGKSGALQLLALSDIFYGHGYALIDPHGDLATDNLSYIPGGRVKDVVYFNPADTAFPMAFNPLEVTNPNQKSNISSEVIGVLKRMFGESWGPRLEYILRYTILALLDRPSATMLDITRMLTDKKFRQETLSYCHDTVVLNFWKVEFASWNEKFQAEAIAPVLNKVGAFTANPVIRNIIGQPKSSFNIREIMDSGKILVVNLSKGLIGEDNAAILGSFLVTKIQLAAMSRSDIERLEDRRPFYLYVDEFQNFATDSFATILSEARKYALNLTVANQYISQMSDTVKDAVFGNVGTSIAFRVSPEDSAPLSKQFEPQFTASDIVNIHNRHFIISMIINGEKVPAFSATTLTLPPTQRNNLDLIIENSRRLYSRSRAEVESEIDSALRPPEHLQPAAKPHNEVTASPNNNGHHIATNGVQEPAIAPQSNDSATEETPAKKRRKRSRRKKNSSQSDNNAGELRINHN